ncbi:MAG: protein kinase [Candidatus Acidiferrum sp.]
MPLAPGTLLGPYEIGSPLGAGGMGEVYRARDTRLDRTVAVKILPANISADPVAKQRFEREAKAISGLNHPNICVLHDVGSLDGLDYLVMECVEGDSLAKRLEKGPLPLEQTLKYGAQIADALDKAHRAGIVHRDLKPGNVMLTASGAKLLDFGLAKPVGALMGDVTMSVAAMRSSPVTQEGMIVGTFQYMSPEQVEGREVDGRSDIFSLGAVLYEMVTGQRAFEGKTQLSVASVILEKEPAAISEVKPMTPPALDHAIRRCLAKDPEERWQTGRDLAGELKWISEGGSQMGAPAGRTSKWREIAVVGLLGALVFTAVMLGYAYFHLERTQGAPTRTSIVPPANAAFGLGYALSPDGTRVVFWAEKVEGQSNLWVRALDSSTAQELAGTANGINPFWSPDGQWIGFFSNGKLRKVHVGGGAVQEIADAPLGRGGTWNAQGMIVFAPAIVGTLQKVPAGGGAPTPVTQIDQSTGELTHRWPNFLPDGQHFLYLARQTSEKQPAGVYVGSLEGNFRKKVLDGPSDAQYVEPGYLLFVHNETLFAQRFDTRKLSVEGDVIPLATDVLKRQRSLWAGVAASQTGQLLYTPTGYESDNELIVTDRKGNTLSSFNLDGDATYIRLSPDGKRMAVALYPSGTTGVGGIWIYGLASELKLRFVFTDAYYVSPVWSPDGTQLAFASTRTGPFNMYLKTLNGGAEEKAIHPAPEDERPQSWSPDGKYLVYDRRSNGRRGVAEVMVLPLNGEGQPYSLLNAPYFNSGGQISPDGRWIAFASDQSGKTEICVSTFPQAKGIWQVSTTGGRTPMWRRDGRALYYSRADGIVVSTEVQAGTDSFSTGATMEVLQRHVTQAGIEANYDVFSDGQHFVILSVRKGTMHSPLTLITNWMGELGKK